MNWWYVAAGAVFIYLPLAFLLASWLGRMMKGPMLEECQHDWETRGYGGAGWILLRCRKCRAQEIV